jgi:hypothetical protein
MLPFSVEVEGVTEEGQGKWVLALDIAGDRLLLVHGDKSLHWHPIADCTFHGTFAPGTPQPMVLVQPQGQPQQQGPKLLTPNRATRRHPLDNGA